MDIHSPMAGGFHDDRGFEVTKLIKYLSEFRIEYIETYNHIGKVSKRNKFTKWVDKKLRKRFPKSGGTFLVVFKSGNRIK